MSMTMAERCDRYDRMLSEGRIIHRAWGDGYERACMLAALAPEVVVGKAGNRKRCPAEVMPSWLAHLVPDMDDRVSDEARPTVQRRFGALARRWSVLNDEAWRRLDYRVRAVALREALRHAGTAADVVRRVLALCERAGLGETEDEQEWRDAEAAAEAAWTGAWTGAEAAVKATWAAAGAAAEAGAEAGAWTAARVAVKAAWTGAKADAWDRMVTLILDEIEAAIVAEESP